MKNKNFDIGDIMHVYYYRDGKFIYHKCEVEEKRIERYGRVISKVKRYLKYSDNGKTYLNYCPNINDIEKVIAKTYLTLYLTRRDDELAYEKFKEYYIDDMNKKIEEINEKIEQLRIAKKESE